MEHTFVALNTRLVLLDEDFNLTFITRHDPRLYVFDKNLGSEIILIYYFTDLLCFSLLYLSPIILKLLLLVCLLLKMNSVN